jgi:large subunit ribosomal protein L16
MTTSLVCVVLMLQPRKFKYKNRQKGRSVQPWVGSRLTYGDCGLLSLQPLRMSAKQIFRLKVFLKRAVKKPDITKRRIWFNVFPHIPLTKKSKGMRMGKGAGKLNAWSINLRGGVFIFEFRNLRYGRAVHFFKKVTTKVPTTTKHVFLNTKRFNIPGVRKTNIHYNTF